ncbi:MAG: endonuclease/exonuclease/phosphatase family protein [Gammaproteobacteria bacterium]|nr:endonuclease/exonuclease/phosphatase family protein [Gammaproteobacteria bacterium]
MIRATIGRAARVAAVATALTTLIALTGLAALAAPAAAAEARTLRLATWNFEWLIAPEQFLALARSCVPRDAPAAFRGRAIPCDTARDAERSALDFAAIERYVRELDADVVAIQEVDGISAARKVFRNHDFCFTAHVGVQNNGFAIRKGIPHRCGPDLIELSLGERVRRGAELILFPGEAREIRLLSVHLKSGCGRRPLDDPRRECGDLARQVPIIERWIDTQAAAGRRFAVLGDFNHDLLAGSGPARNESGQLRNFWAEIDDADPAGLELVNVAAGQRFTNCSPDQNFRSFIDHVVLDGKLAAWRAPASFVRLTYQPADALQRKLPDHCPVGVDLRLPP